MERCRKNKTEAGQAYSVPRPSGYRAQGFSVNSEQLLIFFLAIWFYFFYLQD